MRKRLEHSWDLAPREAAVLQVALRERLALRPPRAFRPSLVAGADVAVGPAQRGKGYAGIVVLDLRTLESVDEAWAAIEVSFPYVPGLLSFRELPAVAAAWERLNVQPDVIIFDGHGTAHPRGFGLACHGGLLLGVPSIGCAKSLLVGEHGSLGEERGARAPIRAGGQVIGMAVRTRAFVRPVYVSPGSDMDLDTAVELVLRAARRYRLPEPIRRSHELVTRLRRRIPA
ncbi:MAG: endonuclease V [Gemmatimonadetes bacterium]|nr:endonuclease V [Gemmatimonadota bacterium]